MKEYYGELVVSRGVRYEDWPLATRISMEIDVGAHRHTGILKGLDDTIVSSPSVGAERVWLLESAAGSAAFHPRPQT